MIIRGPVSAVRLYANPPTGQKIRSNHRAGPLGNLNWAADTGCHML